MSPLSQDPEKRTKQLMNLKPGAGKAGIGNTRSLAHGAYAALAPERIDAKTREVIQALTADAPVRDVDGSLPAADAVAVRQLAETLCRLDDIGDYLNRRGWEDESGRPRPVLEYEARMRGNAIILLRELGMTPTSRAKLGLDLARTQRTLADEIAEGRAAWDAIDSDSEEER